MAQRSPRRRSKGRRSRVSTALQPIAWFALCVTPSVLSAQHTSVISTVHNLSVSGPGSIRSTTEREVCKFCHIPHNANNPEALWGHALSGVAQYDVAEITAGRGMRQPAPQPDGSSRLCLSCHDGTVALGDVSGEPRPIPMGGAQRLGPGHRGFLGTDLTGSHPVSFVVQDVEITDDERDMSLRPAASIQADPKVRIDSQGKMQCTTCHDPHSDQFYRPGEVPRFWVMPTIDEVCLTCHVPR